jgi:Putative auto-transporter adhesin, head GIN domain
MTNQGAPTSLRVGVSRIRFPPIVLLALLFVACGGGERITETRDVAPFDRLVVEDSVDVTVVPGDGREVRVYAGEKVIDRIHTDTVGGALHVDVRDRGIVIGDDPLGDARVEVSATDLRGVTVEASGDVNLSGVHGDELELDVQDAADLDATGSVDRLTATVQGAANANLAGLAVRSAVVDVKDAADADLNVSDELDVQVRGAAEVTYRGDPEVQSDVQDAGDLRRESP